MQMGHLPATLLIPRLTGLVALGHNPIQMAQPPDVRAEQAKAGAPAHPRAPCPRPQLCLGRGTGIDPGLLSPEEEQVGEGTPTLPTDAHETVRYSSISEQP